MIKHYCDRCKKEIPEVLPVTNCKFPIVEIKITNYSDMAFGAGASRLDLCSDCRNSFLNWLNNNLEKENAT